MIIKRDLMCMFAAAGKMPSSTYSNKSVLTTTIPSASPSTLSASTFKSPITASPFSSVPSLSSSPTASKASTYSPTEANKEKEKAEVKEGNVEEEDVLEKQAEMPVDWEKKKDEEEAFNKSYKAAIQETTGDDVDYLHP